MKETLAQRVWRLRLELKATEEQVAAGEPSGDAFVDFTIRRLGTYDPDAIERYRELDASLRALTPGQLIAMSHCWWAQVDASSHTSTAVAASELVIGVADGNGLHISDLSCFLPTTRWVHYRTWSPEFDRHFQSSLLKGDGEFNLAIPEPKQMGSFRKPHRWDWSLPVGEYTPMYDWPVDDLLGAKMGHRWPEPALWLSFTFGTAAVAAWMRQHCRGLSRRAQERVMEALN